MKPVRRKGYLSSAILLLMGISARAQTVATPLTSNRPGIGESEALIGRGVVQVEAGVQAQGEPRGRGPRWTQTWGQLNIRLGLARRVEIFTGWDGLSVERLSACGGSCLVTGGNDVRVGAKLAVISEARHGLTLTVAPAWSFPVGSDAFTSNSNDGSFRLLLARSLPRDWSVSGNLLFTRSSDEDGHYWDNGAMLSLTRAVTSTVSVFDEISGRLLADRPDAWTMDAGVAWVAGPDLQWDASAGHTFNHRGDD